MDYKIFIRYRNVIVIEIFSAICGVVGFVFGVLSLIALFINQTYNKEMSKILTYGWTIVDFLSIAASSWAIVYSYRSKINDIEENWKVRRAAKYSATFDGISIIAGLIGLIFAILSIIYINNVLFSTIFSVITVVFDIFAVVFVVYAFNFLLSELWNGFKFLVKKTKTNEIIKTRKIMSKKIKKQFEQEFKDEYRKKIEDSVNNEINNEMKNDYYNKLREELKPQVIESLEKKFNNIYESRLREKIIKEINSSNLNKPNFRNRQFNNNPIHDVLFKEHFENDHDHSICLEKKRHLNKRPFSRKHHLSKLKKDKKQEFDFSQFAKTPTQDNK